MNPALSVNITTTNVKVIAGTGTSTVSFKTKHITRSLIIIMKRILLPARRRPQGLVVSGVCLSVCVCVRTVFVRKISQERVHGSPPNLVGGSRG